MGFSLFVYRELASEGGEPGFPSVHSPAEAAAGGSRRSGVDVYPPASSWEM